MVTKYSNIKCASRAIAGFAFFLQILDYHDTVPEIYAFAMKSLTDAIELFHFAKIWNKSDEQLTSYLFRQVRKQDCVVWRACVTVCAYTARQTAISPVSSSCMFMGQ